MNITKETLKQLRKTQQKSNYGSQAQAMFVDGLFNYGNWNGGDGLIRQYFSKYNENSIFCDTKVTDIDFLHNEIHFWGDIIITHSWYEERNYATITFAGTCETNGILNPVDYKFEDVAFFTWYKSRGTTESAKYNGKRMTEDQYLFVLNALQETGFKFDLDKIKPAF
ncbi:hypothetical protein [Robertmurraya siralis]|uniref:hypothetical protein n=1 Tax=Robertmurraya siralis TaxID=77777 RepID=UPI0010F7471F|nr:hypothetical protein [Robertmurraya siralis]